MVRFNTTNGKKTMTRYTLRLFFSILVSSSSLFLAACGNDAEVQTEKTPAIPAAETGDPVMGDWVVIHNLSDPE